MRSTIRNYRNHSIRRSLYVLALATAPICAYGDDIVDTLSAAATEKLERGRYLVTVAVCNDCHTPWVMGPEGPEPDMTRMLSGHPQSILLPPVPLLEPGPWIGLIAESNTAWAGPWGISYTANLTPDPETGLGKWSLRDFVDTIRTGRHLGRGRAILPPMPYPMYQHFTDVDLDAIYTFLQTIPAINNKVPDPVIAGIDESMDLPVSAQ